MVSAPILGDAARAAANQFGVDLSLGTDLVTVDRVPRTQTRTSHGLTIRVAGGQVIGAVYGVSHQTARQVEDEWEVNVNGVGYAPVDIVPQNVTERILNVERYDLFARPIENVFSRTGELVSLADQFRPFTLRTIWQSPVGIVLGGRAIYEYTGCWFVNTGRTARTTDDRIVRVAASIRYQSRRRVL